MTTATRASAGSVRQPLAWLQPYLLVLALLGACLGVLVIARMVDGASEPRHDNARDSRATAPLIGPADPRLPQVIKTHFGVMEVAPPTIVAGTTARALGGQSHNIQNYVPPSRQLVQVSVTLRNELGHDVRYDPHWFRLLGARTTAPISSSLRAGTLRAGATVDGTIGFTTPRDGHRLSLQLREPGRAKLRIDFGATGSRYRPRPGDTSNHTAHR